MSPALALLANKSLPFSLYDFHLSGVSAKELAQAYDLPLRWVEERLEAVRLCLKYQVELAFVAKTETAKAERKPRAVAAHACRPVQRPSNVVEIRASA
jgi:hypothetical protein